MKLNWKKTKTLVAWLTLITLVFGKQASLHAQFKLTGVNIRSTYTPESDYIGPDDAEKSLSKTAETRTSLGLAFSLSNKTDSVNNTFRSWSASLNGSYINFSHKQYDQPVLPERLVTLDFGIQYLRSLKNRWSLLSMISVGVYSDMDKVNGKDFFVNAGAAFIKTYNPQLSIGFGGFINNSFETPVLWPAVIVRWQTGRMFRLNVDLPSDQDPGTAIAYRIAYSYIMNKQSEVSLVFKPRMSLYDTEVHGDKNRMLTAMELPLGIENRWRINNIDLVVGAGAIMLRNYRFGEKKLSKMFAKTPDHRIESNYFINLGVAWTLR